MGHRKGAHSRAAAGWQDSHRLCAERNGLEARTRTAAGLISEEAGGWFLRTPRYRRGRCQVYVWLRLKRPSRDLIPPAYSPTLALRSSRSRSRAKVISFANGIAP